MYCWSPNHKRVVECKVLEERHIMRLVCTADGREFEIQYHYLFETREDAQHWLDHNEAVRREKIEQAKVRVGNTVYYNSRTRVVSGVVIRQSNGYSFVRIGRNLFGVSELRQIATSALTKEHSVAKFNAICAGYNS